MTAPTDNGVDLAPRARRATEKRPSARDRRVAVPVWPGMRALGAVLLFATGGVHLDLYVTGYRTIPTIGDLFLLQVISALGLAVAILVARWRITAAAGAGFLLATLGGYLVSLHTPLFGFREVRTTAGVVAGVIEVVGFAVLAALALRPSERGSLTPSRRALPFAGACWAAGALFVLAAVSLGLSLNSTLPGVSSAGGSGARLDATTIGGVSVLTDSSGFTLYWFGPDTPTTSACTGSCLAYWHPLAGTARGCAARSGRSAAPMAPCRPPTTPTPSTPTSVTPRPAMPTGTIST